MNKSFITGWVRKIVADDDIKPDIVLQLRDTIQIVDKPSQKLPIAMPGPSIISEGVSSNAMLIEKGLTNLVPNSSFEDGTLTSWGTAIGTMSRTVDTSYAYHGKYSMAVVGTGTAGGGDGVQSSTIAVASNTTYIASVYVYNPGTLPGTSQPTYGASLGVLGNIAGLITESRNGLHQTTGWQRIFFKFTTGASDTTVAIQLKNYDPGTVWFDAIQLSTSSVDYPTSFVFGDMGPGYSWSGSRFASSAIRTDPHGLFVDLTGKNIPVSGITFMGWGRPSWTNLTVPSSGSDLRRTIAALVDNASLGINLRERPLTAVNSWVVDTGAYIIPATTTTVTNETSSPWNEGDLIWMACTIDANFNISAYGKIGYSGDFIGPITGNILTTFTPRFLYIGDHRGGNEYFDGYVEQVLYFNRALSLTELQSYANLEMVGIDNDAIIDIDFSSRTADWAGLQPIIPDVLANDAINITNVGPVGRKLKWNKRVSR